MRRGFTRPAIERLGFVCAIALIAGHGWAIELIPLVTGGVEDSFPLSGSGDVVSTSSFISKSDTRERRAIIEYDLTSLPRGTVLSASLTGTVGPNNSFDIGDRSHRVDIYTGDGLIGLGDYNVPGIEAGRFSHPSGGRTDFDFDIAGVLNSLLAAGADYLGMRVTPLTDPMFPEVLYTNEAFPDAPRLIVDILPAGAQTVQVAPTFDARVARNDGPYVLEEGDLSINVQRIDFADIDRRGILEYDLTGIPANADVTGVTLTLDVRSFSGTEENGPVAPVHGYAGDGLASISDAFDFGPQIGTVRVTELTEVTVELDAEYVESLLGQSDFLGLALLGDPDYNSYAFSTLEFGAAPFFNPPAMLTIQYIEAEGLAGDFNEDGVVDAADYTVWRDGLGTEYSADDYQVWAGAYGAGRETTATPEPSTSGLIAVAAGLLSARTKRHASMDRCQSLR